MSQQQPPPDDFPSASARRSDVSGAPSPDLPDSDNGGGTDDGFGGKAAAEITSIMTTPSTPMPGTPNFAPVDRPSSVPFPELDLGNRLRAHSSFDSAFGHGDAVSGAGEQHGFRYAREDDDFLTDACSSSSQLTNPHHRAVSRATLTTLPVELICLIIDLVSGFGQGSAAPRLGPGRPGASRNWSIALRHPRRRELSPLATVNRLFRTLVQERLYAHIKLKATDLSLAKAASHFLENGHLAAHVRHIEFWFPVFHIDNRRSPDSLPPFIKTGARRNFTVTHQSRSVVSIQAAFAFVNKLLPNATVLTLEGGQRRGVTPVSLLGYTSTRLVELLRPVPTDELPRLEGLRVLVTKGQWNLIRGTDDHVKIAAALPNLTEWQATYTRSKTKSYMSMAPALARADGLPLSIKRYNLNLEGDCTKRIWAQKFFRRVTGGSGHFCFPLATAASRMEHFSYTGRVCGRFFESLGDAAREGAVTGGRGSVAATHLKSIEVSVRNPCHEEEPRADWNGVEDMSFIAAFEDIVVQAIKALRWLDKVEYLRIRYCEWACALPPVRPFFMIKDGVCSGVWSEQIVKLMAEVRPEVTFVPFVETWDAVGEYLVDKFYVHIGVRREQMKSLKLSNYGLLAEGIV